MIDITYADLRTVIRTAYELSRPQGMGFLHFKDEPLSEQEIDAILASGNPLYPVSMDYVNGRSCKFSVVVRDGLRLIGDRWYDHSESQLDQLLKTIGVTRTATA